MSVRTPEGFVRKSIWQVADVRRPLVSASHIIQVGSDLFTGKNEAYIMNRKQKEKSSCRRKRAKEASYIRLQQTKNLTAGGVSVEDRSKRTETVRPQVANQSATVR